MCFLWFTRTTKSHGGPICGLCEPQKHMVDPFVVYVNHKKHMNHKNVHHVFVVVHMNHVYPFHVFLVVYVKHINTWWTHLWFM